MKEIGSYEAKTNFSKMLRAVRSGEEFLITNHGKPIAKLVPASRRSDRGVSEVIADLLDFHTQTNCSDVRLEDVQTIRNAGRR